MTTLSVLAGGRGDRGLIVALKLVVSAPFRFIGFVATPKVMTLAVDAGWRGAKTSSFGTVSKFSRHDAKVTTLTVDAGCHDAITSSFGTVSKVSRRDAKSDDPYSGRGVA